MDIDSLILSVSDELEKHEKITIYIDRNGLDFYLEKADGSDFKCPEELRFTDQLKWAIDKLKEEEKEDEKMDHTKRND